MNITITLQADSKLLEAIETIANALSIKLATPTETKKASKMSVVKEKEETPPPPVEPETTTIPVATREIVDLDIVKVRAIAAEASQAGKKEAIKGILKELNVARVTDLKEDQFSEFVQKIKAL